MNTIPFRPNINISALLNSAFHKDERWASPAAEVEIGGRKWSVIYSHHGLQETKTNVFAEKGVLGVISYLFRLAAWNLFHSDKKASPDKPTWKIVHTKVETAATYTPSEGSLPLDLTEAVELALIANPQMSDFEYFTNRILGANKKPDGSYAKSRYKVIQKFVDSRLTAVSIEVKGQGISRFISLDLSK